MVKSGNIFGGVRPGLSGEETAVLAGHPGAVVERIVSTGQASPPGFWYDQDWTEWVVVLAGEAGLRIEGEAAPRTLRVGDHVELPAHVRHRVEWTLADPPTVWLAVHWKEGETSTSSEARLGGREVSDCSQSHPSPRPTHAPNARAANPIMATNAASDASSAKSRNVTRANSRIRTSSGTE